MDTIAAIATPPGTGALGMMRLGGPDARAIALAMAGVCALEPRKATLVAVCDDAGPIDQGVAVYYPESSSPIGSELVEFSLHGSPYILSRALSRALGLGARLAGPGEFTQRSFLAGKLDLAQAEAVCALVRARAQATHRAALRQLSGGLSQAVRACRKPLFELLVRVEACLDHPEEDLPSLPAASAREALRTARAPIALLAESFAQGRLAAEGVRLALVGRPNAGKSTLFNALLGYQRAIVQPDPGTTRDTLEQACEIEGLPAVLIDTAGLREDCTGGAEREGVRRAEAALKSCDAAVLVIDASKAPSSEDLRAQQRVISATRRNGAPLVCALNKVDLARVLDSTALPRPVAVSARLGTGLGELKRSVVSALGAAHETEPVLVTSARHAEALKRCACELECATAAIERYGARWEDRVAYHLRQACRELGAILGEGAPEETLRAVFSRFCVGK